MSETQNFNRLPTDRVGGILSKVWNKFSGAARNVCMDTIENVLCIFAPDEDQGTPPKSNPTPLEKKPSSDE